MGLPEVLERYTCARCRRVTMGKPGQVAVTCSYCGMVDLGTELARQQWRTVAEVRLSQRGSEAVGSKAKTTIAILAAALLTVVAMLTTAHADPVPVDKCDIDIETEVTTYGENQ
jgi:hypothetical protein